MCRAKWCSTICSWNDAGWFLTCIIHTFPTARANCQHLSAMLALPL